MKLALSIGGTQIQVPNDIQRLNDQLSASPFGANLFRLAINVLLFGAVILSLFFIVYGGIKWIMSEGDSKNIEQARGTILFAVIGLFIAFFAMFIINVIGRFFNVPLLGQ